MIFVVVKQFVRRLDKWSVAQIKNELTHLSLKAKAFFMESLILAQSERWRRA